MLLINSKKQIQLHWAQAENAILHLAYNSNFAGSAIPDDLCTRRISAQLAPQPTGHSYAYDLYVQWLASDIQKKSTFFNHMHSYLGRKVLHISVLH